MPFLTGGPQLKMGSHGEKDLIFTYSAASYLV